MRTRWLMVALLVSALAVAARAEDEPPAQDRITPQAEENTPDPLLSTKPIKKTETPAPEAAPTGLLPWKKVPSADAAKPASEGKPAAPAAAASPFGRANGGAAPVGGGQVQGKVPFGHAEPPAPVIPAGPHQSLAMPVTGVDSVEVSEPAPPTPMAPGADPVKEDPAAPTNLTSPIFDGLTDSGAPRVVVFRVLNKVTAQSTLSKLKPQENTRFGKLEIMAVMCRNSAPTSQPDAAGLLDIRESQPGAKEMKPLFRGWMYASSPSIAALEHPIYDVTMVSCDLAVPPPAPKAEEPAAKPDKKAAAKKKK